MSKIVEIDETELMQLQTLKGVVAKMMANPEARRKVQEAQKAINPNAVIPEIDAVAPVTKEIDAIRKEISDFKSEQKKEKDEADAKKAREELEVRWMKGRAAAKSRGYTDEGVSALEKYMEEKGVADHEIAMASFEKIHPPEAPVASSNSGFDVFKSISDTNEQMKKLLDSKGQDRGAVSALVSQALTDVRQGAR